jgi:hypothetical protein
MTRSIFTFIFILLAARWIKWELNSNVSLKKHWKWIAGAITFQLLAELISANFSDQFIGNILLHTIGGGVTSSCLFFYLIRTFTIKVNWRLELGMLFLAISALGVLNELWEFSFELLHLGKYSFDTHDTWRDLASNTFGGILSWGIIHTYLSLKEKLK